MRISDEERREVAHRMRECDVSGFKESAIVPFLECLGLGYADWRGVLDRLADLIDRPTTTLTEDEDGRICCANCGCTALYMSDAVYCPDCGAVVTEEED